MLVAHVAGEAQEVVEAVAGDVGEPADVRLGLEEIEHGSHVDHRGLEDDVAERAAQARRRPSCTSARTLRASV